jgi:hypothetical protein
VAVPVQPSVGQSPAVTQDAVGKQVPPLQVPPLQAVPSATGVVMQSPFWQTLDRHGFEVDAQSVSATQETHLPRVSEQVPGQASCVWPVPLWSQ